MFKAILLLVVVAAVSAQQRVNLRQCPGGHRMPTWFESHQCTVDRCTLQRNAIFAGRAHVIPHRQFALLDVAVEATAFGIPIDMPIPDGFESACDFLEAGASCPVTLGNEYVWALQFPIQSFLPALSNIVIRRKLNFVETYWAKTYLNPIHSFRW